MSKSGQQPAKADQGGQRSPGTSKSGDKAKAEPRGAQKAGVAPDSATGKKNAGTRPKSGGA